MVSSTVFSSFVVRLLPANHVRFLRSSSSQHSRSWITRSHLVRKYDHASLVPDMVIDGLLTFSTFAAFAFAFAGVAAYPQDL